MQNSFRRSYIGLTLFGPLAVAASVATFKVGRSLVLSGAQLSLSDSGTGANATTAVVKVNGTAVTTGLSVAGAAAGVTSYSVAKGGKTAPYPAGISLNAGDIVTVDITGIPAGNAPKGGTVQLDVTEVDV